MGNAPIVNVEGKSWPTATQLKRVALLGKDRAWLKELSAQIAGYRGVNGSLNGLWTCRRGSQVFVFNSTAKPVATTVEAQSAEMAPYAIWWNEPAKQGN